ADAGAVLGSGADTAPLRRAGAGPASQRGRDHLAHPRPGRSAPADPGRRDRQAPRPWLDAECHGRLAPARHRGRGRRHRFGGGAGRYAVLSAAIGAGTLELAALLHDTRAFPCRGDGGAGPSPRPARTDECPASHPVLDPLLSPARGHHHRDRRMKNLRRHSLPPEALDTADRAILNTLQEGFPLTPRPFDDAGATLGLTGAQLITRLQRLREIGAITRFGPFFDAEAMGGAFCLCALSVPEPDFDRIAALVNAHAEVAHNYARDHA